VNPPFRTPAYARFPTAAIALLLLSTATLLAQTPMAGTWKMNLAKSKLTGETITFTPEAGGAIRYTAEGRSYTFKPDGSDTPTPTGMIAAWKAIDDTTWESQYKKGSTLIDTDTWKLSPDGKELHINSKGTRPNGEKFSDDAEFVRVSGTKGFYGKWKNTKVSDSNPTSYVIEDKPDGSMVWTIPDFKASVTIKPDGKDYPATGPTMPDGFTLSLTKTGPRSFALTEKIKGKPLVKATYTVAADGKVMTEEGSAVGVNEPYTAVYDKQ
jgi:hypothetical protein